MKSNYKKILCGLIPLISIVLLAPLAQSQAEQDTSYKESQMCCELEAFNPSIKLILSNTSADPDNCQLVVKVKSGAVRCVRFKTTAGKVVKLTPGESIPLSTLLDKTKDGKNTFKITLVPDKSSHAELVLSIKDAEGNSVGEPLSVVWREATLFQKGQRAVINFGKGVVTVWCALSVLVGIWLLMGPS